MPGPGSLRAFFTLSRADQRPTSPTFSEATDASGADLGEDAPEKIITRAQLKASVANYDKVGTRCLASYLVDLGHSSCLRAPRTGLRS
jgi:hypothetical protein